MPTVISARPSRRRIIIFTSTARKITPSSNASDTRDPKQLLTENPLSELNSEDRSSQDIDSSLNPASMNSDSSRPAVPRLFTSPPPLRDPLVTETSILQDETVQGCLPFLAGPTEAGRSPFNFSAHGVPRLDRQRHIAFLHGSLGILPAGTVALDASRPWMLYWALTGLSLLGEDISQYRERVVQTVAPAQNADGGFGGGHGQLSHCAPSYAAILSLVMVGGSAALDLIDRRSLWKWLGTIKQADGGFAVCQGGEVDVRGAYCAMVMISLLRIPLELPEDAPVRRHGITSFLDDLPMWLSRCQTYEGGIAGSPGTEAHGGYAFCALACMSMLGDPREDFPKYFDLPLLTSWISTRQYAPEGGFAGRTNKLVDACYSHWVGGCWPLLESILVTPHLQGRREGEAAVGSLYSRDGLIRYILACCQAKHGGLRDKPGKRSDSYHTCYALAGLSSAQHRNEFAMGDEPLPSPVGYAFAWTHLEASTDGSPSDMQICRKEDMVEPIHPIYAIPFAAVEHTRRWFEGKEGF